MAEARFLTSDEFTLRDRLFWGGTGFYALGNAGGLVADGFPQWSFLVFLDFYNFAALAVAVGGFVFPWWKKSFAAGVMIFAGASTFPLTLVYHLWAGGPSPDVAAYNNLFVVSTFLGPAVFLVGKWSAVVFGATLLAMMVLAVLVGPAPLVAQHLWFEVPGVVGVTFLLFRYRGALDRVLSDLQRSLAENKAHRDRERLVALGELAAGIAHEIKNPLNFVVNFAESSVDLLDDLDQADDEERAYLLRELRTNLLEIQAQGQRGVSIVQTMLLHARSAPGDFEIFDVNVVAGDCLRLSWLSYRDKVRTSVRQRFVAAPAPVLVRGNRSDLTRAFVNLCSNAFWSVSSEAKRASPGYIAEVVVEVCVMGSEAWIVFRDNGLGFDDKTKARLFVPFFTTKSPGEGTGLGLSLTHEVVDQHHGRLEAEGSPHKGATFTVVLNTAEGPL